MARVAIVKTVPLTSGVSPVAEVDGDTVNGHECNLSQKTAFTIRNADGAASHSVTFITQQTVDGLAVADRIVVIPASATRVFSKFDTRVYGKLMQIDVDSTQLKLQAMEP